VTVGGIRGVILAGGAGSRLFPLTKVTNKHLLPMGKRPMIIHSVKKLVSAGVKEIMVITGTEHMGDMITLLGSGYEYDCNFTFRVQDRPDGIAGALSLCEDFAAKDPIVVILGDNIFESSLDEMIEKFNRRDKKKKTCLLCLKEVKDPKRFGVPLIKDRNIVKIIEKPVSPPTNYCVTGIYVYDSHVFEFIRNLKVSDRGEYEITDVNNTYIKEGHAMSHILQGWWSDAGTHESYHKANELILQ